MSYTDSRGYTHHTQQPLIHAYRESSSDSATSYTSNSSDYYNRSDMSSRSDDAHAGSTGEQDIRYRDPNDKRKYVEGKDSAGGNVHIVQHGSGYVNYDTAEPRSGDSRRSNKEDKRTDKKHRSSSHRT